MELVSHLCFTIAILTDKCAGIPRLTRVLISLKEYVYALYGYMRTLPSDLVNPLIIAPDYLCNTFFLVKYDMKVSPWLKLTHYPDKNIWLYFTVLRITAIVMDDILLLNLTLPLIAKSL